jgi:hypothetical protein
MAWDRPIRVLVSAAAIAALAACGGGMSNIAPAAGGGASYAALPAAPKGLQVTQAPTSRLNAIESTVRPNAVASPSSSPAPTPAPTNALTNWQLIEPLYVTPNLSFNVVPWVNQCTTLNADQGLWYIGLIPFSMPLSPFNLPACAIPSPAPSQWFAKERPNSVIPSARLYVVELDVSLFTITSTPIASESPTSPSGQFQMLPAQTAVTYQPGNLYSFFLAEWLNAPPAVPEGESTGI